MAQGDPADSGNDAAIDSEWEYEYSQDETEELYFILDFPIPVEPEVEPTTTKRCVIKFPGNEAAPTDDRDGSATPEWTPDHGVIRRSSVKDEIQITDLHTMHPLIAYKQQIYSCNWASTLGTDMLFYRPAEGEQQLVDPPSRLLATSAAKLVARPVDVQRKQQSSAAPTIAANQENESSHDIKVQKQVNFLEWLQAAKRKRGETDTVPMEPVLTLRRPVDWVDQEKYDQARKEHEDRKRKTKPTEETPKKSRKKKRKTNAEENGQPARARPSRPLGRPPGRKSNKVLQNLLGFRPSSERGRKSQATSRDSADNGNDAAPISTPTPSRFEFVESEDGQRVARVPQEGMGSDRVDDADTPIDPAIA